MSKIDLEEFDLDATVPDVDDIEDIKDTEDTEDVDELEEVTDIDDIEEIDNIDDIETEDVDKVWEKKKEDEKKKGVFSELISFLLYIGVAMAVTFFIINFVGQRTVVSGPSMQNTLHDGDNIILDKISYRLHKPERFDIIVFPVPEVEKHYIKRVIGLPGETVQIINGFVHVSDEEGRLKPLEESYGSEIILDMENGGYLTTHPVKLGENEYYVLGDNRNNSIDSTEMGPISGDIIEGRAWVRIYPFDSVGVLD